MKKLTLTTLTLLVVILHRFSFSAEDYFLRSYPARCAQGKTCILENDISSFYYNPATLSKINDLQILTSSNNLSDFSMRTSLFSFAYPTTGGVIGASLIFSKVDDIPITTRDIGSPAIGTTSTKENGIILSYARNVNKISTGINLKFLDAKYYNTKTSSYGMDLGMIYEVQPKLLYALNLQNIIQPKVQDDKIPLNIKQGISYKTDWGRLLVGIDTSKDKAINMKFSTSLEYEIPPVLLSLGSYDKRLSASILINFEEYRLDYSYIWNSDIGDTQNISLIMKISPEKIKNIKIGKNRERKEIITEEKNTENIASKKQEEIVEKKEEDAYIEQKVEVIPQTEKREETTQIEKKPIPTVAKEIKEKDTFAVYITAITGDTIEIPLGRISGIKDNMKLYLTRKGKKIGDCKIQTINDTSTILKVTLYDKNQKILPDDFVTNY